MICLPGRCASTASRPPLKRQAAPTELTGDRGTDGSNPPPSSSESGELRTKPWSSGSRSANTAAWSGCRGGSALHRASSGKLGRSDWSTPCAQFFPVPPPCSSSAVPWLSQPIRRSWPRQRPKFVKQCVTRRRKLGDVSGDDHPRARGRIDLQGADSARGGPSLDLSALSNPEAKPQGPRRDMPQCGQSSAVRAYRAVIGGFDRPLPMLGTICRCPSRSKARSWPQSHGRLANVGLGWPAGLDRAGEQRRMG